MKNARYTALSLMHSINRASARLAAKGDIDSACTMALASARLFGEGTLLGHEAALQEAMCAPCGTSRMVAGRMLSEARRQLESLPLEALEKERTDAINELTLMGVELAVPDGHAELGDSLVREWRDPRASLAVVAVLEERAIALLSSSLTPRPSDPDPVDPLAMRIARRKFTEAYANTLGPLQRRILGEHASGDDDAVDSSMATIRSDARKMLGEYGTLCESKMVCERLVDVSLALDRLEGCRDRNQSLVGHLALAGVVDALASNDESKDR